MKPELYSIASVILVSLIAVFAAMPLYFKKEISKKYLLALLSLSVGVLLSTVFIGFLPEIAEHGFGMVHSLLIIIGFVFFLVLEKLVHWHHSNKCEKHDTGHSHAYNLAPINLIGDGIHNFIDGLVIAASYAAGPIIGITATISIIFHEVPQEIADFGVLLYSGLSKKKALLLNFFSALMAVVGVLLGIVLAGSSEHFSEYVLPFAAGNFIYIAASNLVPELHRHCKLRDTLVHILAIFLGVAIIMLVTMLGPAHAH